MPYFYNLNESEKIFLIILSIIILIAGWFLKRIFIKITFFISKLIGKSGEKKAEEILKKNGFLILKKQFTIKGYLKKNNKIKSFILRPYYLVKKNGKKYIAEVKTGLVSSIENRYTRRQLLEYSVHHKSPEIILVDIKEKSISVIEFL